MPKYKLTYFDVRARAEVSRYLFAIADEEYEDIRFEYLGWPEKKAHTPYGALPLLEVGGVVLCQSRAIERYLAKQFELIGKTEWDHARASMIQDCVYDVFSFLTPLVGEKDESKKKQIKDKFLSEQFPQAMDNFERARRENNYGRHGHFVGNDVTVADISFYHLINVSGDILGEKLPLSWDRWLCLKKLYENVANHPKVKEWEAKRPKNIF